MGHELRIRIKTLVMILMMVVCANVGDLMLKRGMTQVGAVEISASAVDADRFRLSVKDNGIGIRPEDMKRLFREFEQLDSGAGRRFEGTGLGLALTRKIVELQGGSISVESEPEKGSTFTVVLPRVVGAGQTRAVEVIT